MIAERTRNGTFEPHQRDVTDGVQPPWKLLVDVVPKSSHEVITVTKKIENTVQLVTGLDFHTSTIEDLWVALMNEVAILERTRRIRRLTAIGLH